MTEKFKVGDRVQFKTWDEMEREYGRGTGELSDCVKAGDAYFIDRMRHLCGTYATVCWVGEAAIALIGFTADSDTTWAYTPEMLKHAKEE